MPCALCKFEKPLQRSHIVPEFMHSPMYGQKHKFLAISVDASVGPETHQSGIRNRLLCKDCEQLLGRFEDYASRAFYRPVMKELKRPAHGIIGVTLDYGRFKLFLNSMLWRFAVVPEKEFRPARLGVHGEKLREMLLSKNPGTWLEYPCRITAVMLNGKFHGDFIAGSFSEMIGGSETWSAMISGLYFEFFVGGELPPIGLHADFLKPDDALRIGVKEMREIRLLYEFALDVGYAHFGRPGAKRN